MKNINFGIRLSEALAKAKLTQGELARRLETSPSLVSRWRNGEIAPGVNNYKKLAKILNVDMGWLMGGDMPAKPIAKSTYETITNAEQEAEMLYKLKYDLLMEKYVEKSELVIELQQKLLMNAGVDEKKPHGFPKKRQG